jgi:N-acetylmuramoyl-L-alanine amidase
MTIKQIAYNYSKRTEPIKYIVIHDTGNTSKGANAESHYKYFNGGNRGSSADFFVDDKQILQVNDYTKYYTWHCGDGKGKYGITNSNSVGIEMCINADGDYNKAFDNLVWLTRKLMAELKIPIDRVVRHYDASRKNCPKSFMYANWSLWDKFKKRLEGDEVKRYDWIKDMPDWAKPTVEKLYNRGIIKGDENGALNLTEDIMRVLVWHDRLGLYD